MAIAKRTIVDQIEITRDGTVQVRVGLLLVEDGKEIDCKWHRTAIPPGGDVEAQMAAVNAHLVAMEKEPLAPAAIDRIKRYAAVEAAPG